MKLIENERALFSDRKSFLFPPGMASDGVTTPSGQGFFVGFPIPVENRDAALCAERGDWSAPSQNVHLGRRGSRRSKKDKGREITSGQMVLKSRTHDAFGYCRHETLKHE